MTKVLEAMTVSGFFLAIFVALESLYENHSGREIFVKYLLAKPSDQQVWNIKQVIIKSFFERFSGEYFLSIRFLGFSVAFTFLIIILQAAVLFVINNPLFYAILSMISKQSLAVEVIIVLFFLFNIFSNYLSLGQTKFFLYMLRRYRGTMPFLMIAYGDLMLTASIFLVVNTFALTIGLYVYSASFTSTSYVRIRWLDDVEGKEIGIDERINNNHGFTIIWEHPEPGPENLGESLKAYYKRSGSMTQYFRGGSSATYRKNSKYKNIEDYLEELHQIRPYVSYDLLRGQDIKKMKSPDGNIMEANCRVTIRNPLRIDNMGVVFSRSFFSTVASYTSSLETGFSAYYVTVLPANLLLAIKTFPRGDPYGRENIEPLETIFTNEYIEQERDTVPVGSFAFSTFATSLWIYGLMLTIATLKAAHTLRRVLLPDVSFFPLGNKPFIACGLVISAYAAVLTWLLT
jgi:hypothetical protein